MALNLELWRPDLMETFWVCDVIVDVFSQHGCSFNKHYCQTLPRLLSYLFWSRESIGAKSVFTSILIQT